MTRALADPTTYSRTGFLLALPVVLSNDKGIFVATDQMKCTAESVRIGGATTTSDSWRPVQPIPVGKHAQVVFELLRSADGPMRKGVEVGVFHGVTAANLLALMPDLQLYGVDPWAQYPADAEQSRPDHVQQLGDTKTLYWGLPIALRHLAVNANRWHPIRLPSVKAARCFEDRELEFVFIDGNHSYETVKADIEAWWPKIRNGGLLIGHDYDPKRFPGVCRAVDAFAESQQARIVIGSSAILVACGLASARFFQASLRCPNVE